MSQFNRRAFVAQIVAGSAVLSVGRARAGAEPQRVSESDPSARATGFHSNTAQVDQTQYPQHDATQGCGDCQQFTPGVNGSGTCAFYGGRQVPNDAWCGQFENDKPTS